MQRIKIYYKEFPTAAFLATAGAWLIFINGLWVALNGSVIIIQSSPASYVDEIQSTFWWRLSLGLPNYVEGTLIIFWLIFTVLLLFVAMSLLIKPKASLSLNALIIFCSIISIPIGGGFIIGSILSIIGGLVGIEWQKPIGETFVGRFIRALRLDSTLFSVVSKESKYLKHATWVLILANIGSGLGYGIYNYNLFMMDNHPEAKHVILILGGTLFDLSILYYPIIYIGLAFIKWFTLTTLIYMFGVKLKGGKGEFSGIATATAYAYAPAILQFFLPLVFSTQPTQWTGSVFWVTNIWIIFSLLIAVKESLEISRSDAIGLLMITGGLYWIVTYKGIVPYFQVPGIWFTLEPSSFVLLLFSMGAVLSTLTGFFNRR
jgi:hypothetical protein